MTNFSGLRLVGSCVYRAEAKGCLRRLLVILALLSLPIIAQSVSAGPPTLRGDWDGDGYSDLALGLVRPLAGGQYQTEILARGSKGKPISYVIPQKTDAFSVGKYLRNEPSLPASVLVTSINEPLLWTMVKPSTREVLQFRYGLPGDSIKNAMSFDGDGLDDIYVIRKGPVNEFYDNKQYMHWLVHQSARKGEIADVVFGLPQDRLFTFYVGSAPHLGAVRVETEGDCKDQIVWYWMNFDLSPIARKVGRACWGLPGDIPLVPNWYNGRLKLVVVRPSGNIQTAYIRDFQRPEMWQTLNLGLADAIPGLGKVYYDKDTFFWHQRSTPTLGDTSFLGMFRTNGTVKVERFGITSNVILRPDGTVVQPNEKDILEASPTAQCAEIVTSGYLWKPSSQDTSDSREGYPLILLSGYWSSSSCLQVVSANGQQFSCLGQYAANRFYEGYKCGLSSGPPCNGRTSASGLAQQSLSLGGTNGGFVFDSETRRCYTVPDFSKRYDKR